MIETDFDSEQYNEDEGFYESQIFNEMIVSPKDLIRYAKNWCEAQEKEAHEKGKKWDEECWHDALAECGKYEVEYNDGIIE